MNERKPARQTCTDHATCCDRHFHGLAAFDLHRKGGECTDPAEIFRKDGEPALQVWTDTGSCTLLTGSRVEGVTIWQVATTAEARERLQGLRLKPSAPARGQA